MKIFNFVSPPHFIKMVNLGGWIEEDIPLPPTAFPFSYHSSSHSGYGGDRPSSGNEDVPPPSYHSISAQEMIGDGNVDIKFESLQDADFHGEHLISLINIITDV